VVILAGVLTRRPVLETARSYVEKGGRLPRLPRTIPEVKSTGAETLDLSKGTMLKVPFGGTPTKEQEKALASLGPARVIHIHDDGDRTVEVKGKKYVVTTDGEIFAHYSGKEALKKLQACNYQTATYVTILDPGQTTFRRGELIALDTFVEENLRVKHLGERPAVAISLLSSERLGGGNGHHHNHFSFSTIKPGELEVAIRETQGLASSRHIKDKLDSWNKYVKKAFVEAYEGGDWPKVHSLTADLTGSALSRNLTLAGLYDVLKEQQSPHQHNETYEEKMKRQGEQLKRGEELLKKGKEALGQEPGRRSRAEGDMNFLPDSPEFVAQTIDHTGWRERIDEEFQTAIARTR